MTKKKATGKVDNKTERACELIGKALSTPETGEVILAGIERSRKRNGKKGELDKNISKLLSMSLESLAVYLKSEDGQREVKDLQNGLKKYSGGVRERSEERRKHYVKKHKEQKRWVKELLGIE